MIGGGASGAKQRRRLFANSGRGCLVRERSATDFAIPLLRGSRLLFA